MRSCVESYFELFEKGVIFTEDNWCFISNEIKNEFHLAQIIVRPVPSALEFVQIRILEVKTSFRGQGFGSTFVKSFSEWIKTKGKTICLTPNGLSERYMNGPYLRFLRAFYEKLGFIYNEGKDYRKGCSDMMYYCPDKQQI